MAISFRQGRRPHFFQRGAQAANHEMKVTQMRRRDLARLALAATVIGIARSNAVAQERYPNKPIRIVVGFPAGQSSDVGARTIAAGLTRELGQTVWVDNKPGAAGIIAHEAVKNAPPDGYTLLMSSTAPLTINPSLYRKLPYDTLRDFTPIVLVNTSPMFLVSGAGSPFNTMRDLIAFAKANPGKISYGSSGSGTTAHIAMEMLKKEAGIDMVHVPYKGSPGMITDLIAGHAQVGFDAASAAAPQIAAGKLKALAASSLTRSPRFPDVPTVAEQGLPGYQALTWAALIGPAGMPPAVVESLNAAVNKVLKSKDVQEHFAKVGSTVNGGSSASFADFLRLEVDRWGRAVKASGAQVD